MVSGRTTIREAIERLVKTTEMQYKEINHLYQIVYFLKRVVLLDAFLFGVIVAILIKLLTN